jgi:AraC-like DNA-binding protein
MQTIKTYKAVHPDDHALSFDIKRMEDIYDRMAGKADDPHRHDYFTLVIVKDAAGKHIVDFNAFDLAPSQIYFVSPGQVHQIIERKKSYGYAITFSPQFMFENGIDRRFVEDLYLFHDFGYAPPLLMDEPELQSISDLAEKILKEIRMDHPFKYQAIGAWLKLLLIRCHSICSISQEDNTQRVQASVTILKNFKNLLEEHYRQWHKVQEYAEQLAVSADYLNVSIKSLTGKSVKEHIQSRITIAAKRLLLFAELTTKEIAYELGFSAPANFSQFFKKCTGQSPSDFRKKQAT